MQCTTVPSGGKTIRLRNLIDDGYNLKDIKNAFENVEERRNVALQLQTDDFLELIEDYDFTTLFEDDRPITNNLLLK